MTNELYECSGARALTPEKDHLDVIDPSHPRNSLEGRPPSMESFDENPDGSIILNTGFETHISDKELLDSNSNSSYTVEDGTVHYDMHKEQFLDVLTTTAKGCISNALKSEVINTLSITEEEIAFYQQGEKDIDKVHLLAGCVIEVSMEDLEKIIEENNSSDDKVFEIKKLGIRLGEVLTTFDYTVHMQSVLSTLHSTYNLHVWSVGLIDLMSRKTVATYFDKVTYDDIKTLIK
jgi:hypothetical protein